MLIGIFDTETTGYLRFHPYVVQLGCLVLEVDPKNPKDCREVFEYASLVKSPVIVPRQSEDIHGISTDMSRTGIHPKAAARFFQKFVNKCDLLVAHNVSYDQPVMELQAERYLKSDLVLPPTYCTMINSIDLCKIEQEDDGYKWPKLEEALEMLCNHKLEGAHDAMADVRGTAILLKYHMELGLVPSIDELGDYEPKTF